MSIESVIAQNLPQQALAARHEAVAAKAAVPVVPAEKPSTAPPTLDQVQAATEQIAQFLKSSGRALDFHIDSDTGRVVVSVRDSASGDLIRQMPSEEALHLARTLSDGAKSLLELVA